MTVLRTPEERFGQIENYPFAENFLEINDTDLGTLRMHYVDHGPKESLPILMLHGEPSWSYLYRHMIKQVSNEGFRVVAPDLIGFGKSDKPSLREDYTYEKHISWTSALVEHLNLSKVVLLCQDWGGLIGLRLVTKYPDRFAGVVAANTFLPTGEGKVQDAFLKWRDFSQKSEEFNIGKIVSGGCVQPMEEEVVKAYDAPFPDESYKAGARQFPMLVPIKPDQPDAIANKKAWGTLSQWQKPFLTAFSDRDPVTAGADRILQKLIPGCEGQSHTTLKNGGHFLQEDCGKELSNVLVQFIQSNEISL